MSGRPPGVAIDVTEVIMPLELVLTFSTGLIEQPVPLHVIVPETDAP
jgi:hypothetical protein